MAADRPRTTHELLEREEERTLEALKGSLVAAGEDLCALGEVRDFVRRHPHLAVGAGVTLGALCAPLLAGALRAALPLLVRQVSAGATVARGLDAVARRAGAG